jgi:DHA1 family multidrug resistance protein-like MFS transporter
MLTEEAIQTSNAAAPKKKANWLLLTIPVALISAFAELGYAVVSNSAFPVYMKFGLGVDAFLMTLIMIPFFVSEVLFKAIFGVLADRYGRKILMIVGPAVTIFTPILTVAIPYDTHRAGMAGAFCLAGFAILRLLDGAGAAALWPAMFAYIGDVVEEEKRGSAMSFLNVTYIVGLALGFLAGGWVNDTFGPVLSGEAARRHQLFTLGHQLIRALKTNIHHHHATHIPSHMSGGGLDVALSLPAHYYPSFYLTTVLFACAVIIALIAIKDAPREKSAKGVGKDGCSEKLDFYSIIEASKSAPGMMVLTLITFLGIGCITFLVKVFAQAELNLKEEQFGQLILFPAAIVAALAVPFGYLTDLWGKAKSVRLGFAAATIGLWSLVIMFGTTGLHESSLVIAGSLLGLGFVLAFPAWMALLTTISSQSQRGTLIGAISTAQGVGVLLGTLIGGRLYDHFSANSHISHISPFVASSLFLTLATVLSFVLIKNDDA